MLLLARILIKGEIAIESVLPIAAVLGIIGAVLAVIMVIHSAKREIDESVERTGT